MFNNITKNNLITAICLASILTFSCGYSEQVLAQKPSREGFPGRRVGGGTRGGNCFASTQKLTALVPKSNLGLTVSPYPTFFFFIPQTISPQTVEFVLLDDNEHQIYRTTFISSGASGIINLSLPAKSGLPPLATGKNYHWYFSIVCNPANRVEDIFVEGWIQRVELNPVLAIKLQNSSLQERIKLYISADLWHEALVTLAQLRRDRPSDSSIAANWIKLLKSVGLDKIAQQPLIDYQISSPPLTRVQADSK